MSRAALLGAALLAFTATTASAQGYLVVSQNKCSLSRQGEIRRMVDSLWIPIAQELVNEGRLTAAGSAYHAWGDEWNVVMWFTAADIPTFLAAYSELVRRFEQRHPAAMTQMLSGCTDHRDSMYRMGASTTPAAGPPPRRP
jgi:hypothetical protein